MPRYFLEICFNGTRYSGWQIQANATAVQQVVNEALSTWCGTELHTLGCCRTDTGVHAMQFFLHFDTSHPIPDKQSFLFSVNGILPEDIAAFEIYEVPPMAHARYDAHSRTYRYYGFRHKNPFLKNFAGAFLFDLDVTLINECCRLLMNYNDFSAFAKSGTGQDDFSCDIYAARWFFQNGFHCFEITANRFLRGMVRAITGTLVKAGKGQLTADDFCRIIENKNRSLAGVSVPAHGLYLTAVEYPYLKIIRPPYFPFVIDKP